MMIARWTCEAQFGKKRRALDLIKKWHEQIHLQAGIDTARIRTISGAIGARETLLQNEFEIGKLSEFEDFFEKIKEVRMDKEWQEEIDVVIISGSTYWEIFHIVE